MKYCYKIIITLLALASSFHMNGQEKRAIKGFSGGMLVHTGYVFGQDNPYNQPISSPTFGIGGCAKLHLSKTFRAGFEGYFSTAPLRQGLSSGSHNKLFWTGALADWFWKIDRLQPYVGLGAGGGMETTFMMFDGDKHDWIPENNAVFRKQPFVYINPYAGVEFAVGKALHLTLKADWLTTINSDGLNMPHGPRIYFGFIFAH